MLTSSTLQNGNGSLGHKFTGWSLADMMRAFFQTASKMMHSPVAVLCFRSAV
jgi:hypothetical protein